MKLAAPANVRAILGDLQAHPLLVIGGGVGLLALLGLQQRGSGSGAGAAAPATDTTTTDTSSTDSLAPGTGGQYPDPSSLYSPFPLLDTSTGQTPSVPPLDPNGCVVGSQPPVPTGYEGKGAWHCKSGVWVWDWNAPDTTPGGCPLPKPSIPANKVGTGTWHCNASTKHWDWVPKHQPPPKGAPIGPGDVTTYAGKLEGKHPHLVASDRRVTHIAKLQHWQLGQVQSLQFQHISGTGAVNAQRIIHAPGSPHLVGRWLAR